MKFPHAIVASTIATLLCVSTVDSFATVPLASSRNTMHNVPSSSIVTIENRHMPMSLHAHNNNDDANNKKSPMQVLGTAFLSMLLFWNTAAVGGDTLLHPPNVNAAEGSKVVGALKGSGLVFKDTLQIERFNDPKVKNVVLYVSNFERPITEKLSGKNFFNDPSSAGITCAKTGPTSIADNIARGPGKFSQPKPMVLFTPI